MRHYPVKYVPFFNCIAYEPSMMNILGDRLLIQTNTADNVHVWEKDLTWDI